MQDARHSLPGATKRGFGGKNVGRKDRKSAWNVVSIRSMLPLRDVGTLHWVKISLYWRQVVFPRHDLPQLTRASARPAGVPGDAHGRESASRHSPGLPQQFGSSFQDWACSARRANRLLRAGRDSPSSVAAIP